MGREGREGVGEEEEEWMRDKERGGERRGGDRGGRGKEGKGREEVEERVMEGGEEGRRGEGRGGKGRGGEGRGGREMRISTPRWTMNLSIKTQYAYRTLLNGAGCTITLCFKLKSIIFINEYTHVHYLHVHVHVYVHV